jgi:hypothetical protein|nr:MAG TPA: hypothetical protein [Caudoviricetes sp.]
MKNKILYERSLRTCIIMLVVCIVFKLFGVEWFDLNTSIPILQELDEIIMNNYILSFLYSLIFLSINNFFILGVATKTKPTDMVIWSLKFIPLNILLIFSKYYINNPFIDFVLLLLMSYIIDNKSIKRIICYNLLNIVYQFISIFIRNVGMIELTGVVTTTLLMIDYYIMLVITYLFQLLGGIDLWYSQVISSSLVTKLWKKRSKNYLKNKGDD